MNIKERFQFRDISLLMQKVDARQVLIRLGVDPSSIKVYGNELTTFCPDHHLFVGRKSSDPNWGLNLKSGKCKCLTEPRGSNLVFTVARVRGCSPREAVSWMLGKEDAELDLNMMNLQCLASLPDDMRAVNNDDEEEPVLEGLQSVEEESSKGYLSDSAVKFFLCPPEKKPTNIKLPTLRHYKVFERTWGYYHGRVVIPFYFRQQIQGFSAIDKYGVKEWLRRNPLKEKQDYKKVLFPRGMFTSKILFGFDDVEPGCPFLIVTEGPREVMKLWQEGYKNSVALCGTNLSGEHIKLIAELRPQSVVVMLDGDKAGRRAGIKIGKKLKDTFSVFFANVPDGFDPKVLHRKDFKSIIRNADKIDNCLCFDVEVI